MSLKIIRNALESRLSTWALAQSPPIPIAWQNMPFTPPTQARYLRAFLLPAETQDLGEQDDLRAEIGLLQVSVCVPSGEGALSADTLADNLAALFPVALVIPAAGMSITITKTPYASPAQQETGLYVVPVNIRYWATSST